MIFQEGVCYNDFEAWHSISEGPFERDAQIASERPYQPGERALMRRDEKTMAMLKLGLSWKILTSVQHLTSTKEVYDSAIGKFEGNFELKEIKKDILKKHIDNSSSN